MDKHTSMVVTYWLVFIIGMCSVVLYDVGFSPAPITAFEAIALAFLASIWIGVVWEENKKA